MSPKVVCPCTVLVVPPRAVTFFFWLVPYISSMKALLKKKNTRQIQDLVLGNPGGIGSLLIYLEILPPWKKNTSSPPKSCFLTMGVMASTQLGNTECSRWVLKVPLKKIFPAKKNTAIQCNWQYISQVSKVCGWFFPSASLVFFRFWHHFLAEMWWPSIEGRHLSSPPNDNLLMGEKNPSPHGNVRRAADYLPYIPGKSFTCFTHAMLANYGWSNLLNPQKCPKGYRNMKQRLSHFSPDFKESLAMFSSHCTEKFGLWLNDCDWGGKIIGRFIGEWQAF